MFRCAVCSVYSTDSLDALQAHIQLDRSSKQQANGSDQPPGVAVVAGGSYMCTLCQYRTSLKANFQLHCKTDKHLQRLQLVNHVQEGGASVGWDRPLPTSAIDVCCSACDYRTNSVYRLQMHAAGTAHAARVVVFRFLCALEAARTTSSPAGCQRRIYRCLPCGVTTRSRFGLIEHSQTPQHASNEAVHLGRAGLAPGSVGTSTQDAAVDVRILATIFDIEFSDDANDSSSGQFSCSK